MMNFHNIKFTDKLGGLILGGRNFTPAHEKHRLTITAEKNTGEKLNFRCSYQYNPSATKYNDGDGLRAVLSDATCYLSAPDIDSFFAEFGYNKPSDGIRAFEGCRKAYLFFKDCGLTDSDISAFYDKMDN